MEDTHTIARAPRRFSFDLGASWAILGSMGLALIAFIPAPIIPFVYTKVSILALGAVVALAFFIIARLTRGSLVVPPLPLLGALWIVPLAYLLSTLFSGTHPLSALFGSQLESDTLGFMLILSSLATLTALIFRTSAQYRRFFGVLGALLGVTLVAQVVIIVVAKIAPNVITPSVNLIGSFMDFGMLAGLGLVLGMIALRFLDVRGRTKKALLGGMLLAVAVVALSNTPLVWALIALVALALFIEAIMRRRLVLEDGAEGEEVSESKEGKGLGAPLLMLVVSLFFIVGGSTIGNALVSSVGTNTLDVRPSWQSTFTVGSHTYASSPLFGSGPNTFNEQWLQFRDASLNQTIFWNVEFISGIGFIPTSFVTTGIVGVLAWLAFIGLFLYFGIRALLYRQPKDAYTRFAAIGSFVGALYVLTLAFLAVPGPMVLAAGFLMIGLFVSVLRHAAPHTERTIVFGRNPRVGFVIVFALTLLLLASVLAAYAIIERYLARVALAEAQVSANAGNVEAAAAAVRRSLMFAPSDEAYRIATAVSLAEMGRIANDKTLAPSEAQAGFQAALSGSIETALAATQLAPKDYQNWVTLANVYQAVVPLKIEGAYENAKSAYDRASALNPTSPALPLARAQLEIARGNAAAAEAELTKAIGLKNNYTQAIFLLSQLQVQQGKAREALEAAEAAAYFAPSDPAILFQVGVLRIATGNTDGSIQAFARAVEVNPQFANARFFLGVAHAVKGQYAEALTQLRAVAALSEANATAVAADIAVLEDGRNPFPPARLQSLGLTLPAGEPSTPAQ